MDLLYRHISNVPNTEVLKGVYIVDGETQYASTQVNNTYKLYTVTNYALNEFVTTSNTLGSLDTVVAKKLDHIFEQSGHHEDNIRVVIYKTDKLKEKNIKKSSSDRVEISRFTSKYRKKLF